MATAPATTRLPNIKGWVYDDEDSYCRVEDEEAREMVTDAYDPTATYTQGATCIQDNKLYRAKADITTAEVWTPDHWEGTSLEQIRKDMETEISTLNANKHSKLFSVWNGMEVEFFTAGNVGFCYITGTQESALTPGAINQYIQIPQEYGSSQFMRIKLLDQNGIPYIVDMTVDYKFGLYYILANSNSTTNWMGWFSYPLQNI